MLHPATPASPTAPARRRRRTVVAVVAAAVLLGATTTVTARIVLAPAVVETRAPDARLTAVTGGTADVRVSEAVFASSEAAVLVRDDDPVLAAAAGTATALGVPVLGVGDDATAESAELVRLGVTTVFAAGDVRVPLRTAQLVELAADGSAPEGAPDVAPGTPRPEVVALAGDAPDASGTLALATLAAAGARSVTLPGEAPDPQRSPDAVAALADESTAAVVAVGDAFVQDAALDWRVRAAANGWTLPGGAQRVFPDHTVVALYGTPGAPVFGLLGEQDVDASIARARETAAQYDGLTDDTVVPAFEIIASVASGGAGADGDYSNEIDPQTLLPWVEAARDAGMPVVIDLQPGRTDFLTQAQRYEVLLEQPNVGLALDPEWRLAPDEFHLRDIGSVGADEVDAVGDWLAALTDERGLPPKLFVLHQFRADMLPDRERIDTSHPQLETVLHVDGQGSQPAKTATWNALHEDAPANVAWGWKNFVDEDAPMLDPEGTMRVTPAPDLITYQ